jgi:hypothetical protein
VHLDLIPKSRINKERKYELFAQAKQPRKTFNSKGKKTNLLESIHNDICDGNNVLTRSGKRYFIFFFMIFKILLCLFE